jgi:hypothetical protein
MHLSQIMQCLQITWYLLRCDTNLQYRATAHRMISCLSPKLLMPYASWISYVYY